MTPENLALSAQTEHQVAPYEASDAINEGAFHSEKDREIAGQLAQELAERLAHNDLEPNVHATAVSSLMALVPRTTSNGRRVIAGRTLSPTTEKRIASRLNSSEIDVSEREGSWGRLPEIVKQMVVYYGGDLVMELTTSCTAGCSFCPFANKGNISAKMSFEAASSIMEYFALQRGQGGYWGQIRTTDRLYNYTDPFDIKWKAHGDTPERDYSDVASQHTTLNRRFGNGLMTSTAIPIGEEMRVLAFANNYLVNARFGRYQDLLRFSVTRSNRQRVEHIMNILYALHGDLAQRAIIFNTLTNDQIALRGEDARWGTKEIRDWDIIGPNCRDGAVIGVESVDGVIMQGASDERPNGETRQPIERGTDANDVSEYRIPAFWLWPRFDGRIDPRLIYPDARELVVHVDSQGNYRAQEHTIINDPHRVLLRLAGARAHYSALTGMGCGDIQALENQYVQFFGEDAVALSAHYLKNPQNRSMRHVLRSGFFDGSSRMPLDLYYAHLVR